MSIFSDIYFVFLSFGEHFRKSLVQLFFFSFYWFLGFSVLVTILTAFPCISFVQILKLLDSLALSLKLI